MFLPNVAKIFKKELTIIIRLCITAARLPFVKRDSDESIDAASQ
jgi:hypothetical protein